MKTKLIDLLGLTNMANDIRDWVNAHFQRKVDGKGLSTNDYDATAKAKVDAIPADPKYTDTVYDDTALAGRVSTIEGKESGWNAKQDSLVSGTNIKTVNGESLLGSGNIEIQGGGGEENVIEAITMNGASVPVTNKTAAITETDPTVPSWAKQSTKPSYNYSEIGNTPDLSGFITKSVDDLLNYYIKGETYTKAEVQALINAVKQFTYESVASLPTASSNTMHKIYLVPSADPQTSNVKDEYITIESSGSYSWEQIGSTAIDLSGYVTTSALNTALASYATTQDLEDAIDGSKVFWAEVDVTTFAEIQDAVDAGRTVMLKDEDNFVYFISHLGEDYYVSFSSVSGEESLIRYYNVYDDDSYELFEITQIESRSNKVRSISSLSDDIHYPSAKAVYDIVSTKYTKPLTGIPASDLASGVIPTVPVQDVTVGGTSVVSNGTAVIPQEVFWVEYGVTTYSDISTAISDGKIILCEYANIIHVYNKHVYNNNYTALNEYRFYAITGCIVYLVRVNNNNTWNHGSLTLESITSKVTSLSSSSTNTQYPSAKCVYDGLVAVDKVFWATYGTTTAAEIDAAVAAGKLVMCNYSNHSYRLEDYRDNQPLYFSCFVSSQMRYYLNINRTTNVWSGGTITHENAAVNKVSTISGNETSTTKYPNTKAVADALGKWGVISQTQTWSGTGTQPRTYVMSDLVYGTIPQANIDLFESAGATFNATTGYFEINGLTDISYEEMQKIYNNSIVAATYPVSRSMAFATPSSDFIIRCTLPLRATTAFTTNFSYLCYEANLIEQVNIENSYLSATSALTFAFQNAYRLKKIGDGFIKYNGGASDSAFKNCYSLETIYLKGLKANMKFDWSQNLSMESIAYMVANAGTDNITITLHPTAYSAAILDEDVTAALQTKTNVSLASA